MRHKIESPVLYLSHVLAGRGTIACEERKMGSPPSPFQCKEVSSSQVHLAASYQKSLGMIHGRREEVNESVSTQEERGCCIT